MKYRYKTYGFLLLLLTNVGCKKSVEVNPPVTGLVGATVFQTNSTAVSAVTGIYLNMMSGYSTISGGVNTGITPLTGLSSDELVVFPNITPLLTQTFTNALTSTNVAPFWKDFYKYIYLANAVIEGLSKSTGVNSSVNAQLTGEAKFIRAFCLFYLVNLFGNIPIVTSSDYRVNSIISRSETSEVYQKIVEDLKDAQGLLSDKFLKSDGLTPYAAGVEERVRPTKWAATALLARVYLYNKDWTNAELQASLIINNSTFSLLADLNSVFKKNSKEAIWQLQTVDPSVNTYDGFTFNYWLGNPPGSGLTPFYLNKNLLNSFELNDNRKTSWIGSLNTGTQIYYYPYKYKVANVSTVSEYLMVLRLAEQYLIRAEARAQQNNLSGSQEDLNKIRNRANLSNISATDKAFMLSAIEHERQVELFLEWGHRWFDLKRTSRIDAIMSVVTPQKGGTWNKNWQWYPIPATEIQTNSNLSQNDDY